MDRNYFKAFAVIAVFTIAYYLFVLPRFVPDLDERPDRTPPVKETPDDTTPKDTPPQTADNGSDKTGGTGNTVTPGDTGTQTPPPSEQTVTRVGGEDLSRETFVVHTHPGEDDQGMVVEFDPVGACIRTILLKEYPPLEIDRGRTDEKVNPEGKPWLALIRTNPVSSEQHVLRPGMLVDPKGIVPFESVVWERVGQNLPGLNAPENTVAFRAEFSNGLVVEKRFAWDPETYRIGMDVTVRNSADTNARSTFNVVASSGMTSEEYRDEDRNLAFGLRDGGKVKHESVQYDRRFRKLEGKSAGESMRIGDAAVGRVVWAGTTNRYFALVMMIGPSRAEAAPAEEALFRHITPDPAGRDGDERFKKPEPGNAAVLIRPGSVDLAKLDGGRLKPKADFTQQYVFFAGPVRRDVVDRPELADYGLDNLVGGGVTHYLQLLFTYILYFFQTITRNWGLAIILLTVLVRLCMHPLTKKSQVAMHHMQELQPRMKELQEKYKKDKQKLQQETMKLQKEAGFPMFKGCLPMFLQLPIFIALWWSLRSNIFLRGAYLLPPSVGWLDDLSQPDRLYMFAEPIKVLFFTVYEINLLPVLMVAAMIVQQRMQPRSGNPEQAQQQKVMAVMMSVMFLFFFYTMPSGLTLYFLISTVWGVVEGKIIRKHIEEIKAAKKPLYGKADS